MPVFFPHLVDFDKAGHGEAANVYTKRGREKSLPRHLLQTAQVNGMEIIQVQTLDNFFLRIVEGQLESVSIFLKCDRKLFHSISTNI